MKKKIVLQSYAISLITALLIFVSGIATYYAVQERKIENAIVEDAETFADLIAYDVDALAAVEDFGSARVTITDDNGKVVFDSSKGDSENMDDHSGREEISAALAGSSKVVRRYSDTLNRYMYYYALAVDTSDGVMVLRVAESASDIWSFGGMALLWLAIALVAAFALSYVLAKNLSSKVEGRLTELRDALRSANSGDYKLKRCETSDALDFSIISELNELAESLKENYRTLSREKAKLDSVVYNMTQGLIVVDGKETVVLRNNVAEEITNRAPSGAKLINMIDDEALLEKIRSVLAGSDRVTFAYECGDRDVVFNVFTLESDGDGLGVILISDVTKEKELARQKSVFFANASHELKTPLTSVQGLSEVLLSRTDENSPDYKYIKRIHTESVRLHNIVMDMLYISKLESGRIENRREEVRLGAVVEDALAAYKDEITAKRLSVETVGDAVATGDEHNFYECFNNVIGNAVHYNRQDGFVKITLLNSDEGATVKVEDGGIGIAEEHLPFVCERFYRVDKSRSKQTGGTGLGLSIVKHVVALYGGTLDIRSTEGKGTTVTVFLPRS